MIQHAMTWCHFEELCWRALEIWPHIPARSTDGFPASGHTPNRCRAPGPKTHKVDRIPGRERVEGNTSVLPSQTLPTMARTAQDGLQLVRGERLMNLEQWDGIVVHLELWGIFFHICLYRWCLGHGRLIEGSLLIDVCNIGSFIHVEIVRAPSRAEGISSCP